MVTDMFHKLIKSNFTRITISYIMLVLFSLQPLMVHGVINCTETVTKTFNWGGAGANSGRTEPIDVVFVLDSTTSVQDADWGKFLDVARMIAGTNGLNIGDNANDRVAMFEYGGSQGALDGTFPQGVNWLVGDANNYESNITNLNAVTGTNRVIRWNTDEPGGAIKIAQNSLESLANRAGKKQFIFLIHDSDGVGGKDATPSSPNWGGYGYPDGRANVQYGTSSTPVDPSNRIYNIINSWDAAAEVINSGIILVSIKTLRSTDFGAPKMATCRQIDQKNNCAETPQERLAFDLGDMTNMANDVGVIVGLVNSIFGINTNIFTMESALSSTGPDKDPNDQCVEAGQPIFNFTPANDPVFQPIPGTNPPANYWTYSKADKAFFFRLADITGGPLALAGGATQFTVSYCAECETTLCDSDADCAASTPGKPYCKNPATSTAVCVECMNDSHCSGSSKCSIGNSCSGFCGDGTLDPGESCDTGMQGNSDAPDALCSTNCEIVNPDAECTTTLEEFREQMATLDNLFETFYECMNVLPFGTCNPYNNRDLQLMLSLSRGHYAVSPNCPAARGTYTINVGVNQHEIDCRRPPVDIHDRVKP